MERRTWMVTLECAETKTVIVKAPSKDEAITYALERAKKLKRPDWEWVENECEEVEVLDL